MSVGEVMRVRREEVRQRAGLFFREMRGHAGGYRELGRCLAV